MSERPGRIGEVWWYYSQVTLLYLGGDKFLVLDDPSDLFTTYPDLPVIEWVMGYEDRRRPDAWTLIEESNGP
jgi:hypothetical protein